MLTVGQESKKEIPIYYVAADVEFATIRRPFPKRNGGSREESWKTLYKTLQRLAAR